MLKVTFSHDLCPDRLWLDIRVDGGSNLDELKRKVERHTGTEAAHQRLVLFDPEDREVGELIAGLAASGVAKDGYRIHVFDDDPNSVLRQLETSPTPPKYQLDEERYNARTDTARAFLKNLRKHSEDARPGKEERATARSEEGESQEVKLLRAKVQSSSVGCTIKATGINGHAVWTGKISESLAARLHLSPDKIHVGVVLPKQLGLLHGEVRDEGKILFSCKEDESAAMVPLKDLQLIDEHITVDKQAALNPMEL